MTSDPLALYGTTQPRPEIKRLSAGPLSLELENGAIRYVRYNGHEAIRGIDYLVRDSSWRTPPARLTERSAESTERHFEVVLDGEVEQGGIHYRYRLTIEGHDDGRLEVRADAEALSTFKTNRTGFVVLHAIKGVAGRPVTVTHKDGSTSETTFPELISPSQPIFDIRALRHEVTPGLFVTCRMEAALPHDPATIFEMEDQRNWTDASYKTYVGSLLDPWPYEIAQGAEVRQRIALNFEGTAEPATAGAGGPLAITIGEGAGEHVAAGGAATGGAAARRLPTIGLGSMPGDLAAARAAAATLQRLRPPFIAAYVEADQGDLGACLADYASLARQLGAAVQLELILPQGRSPAAVLDESAAACRAAGLEPTRVLACPAPYLKSIQPPGPWPEVADLGHIMNAARRAFPQAAILGGMASYFTELNRKRPPAATIDGISCTTSPIVHAADDRSVMETLEALPSVALSMAAMAPGKPVHVGPSAIAMRHNPYGVATAANPKGERVAMADDDPRQKGLFAAAWSVGYAAAMAEAGVAGLALNHLAGPSGVLAGDGGVQPVFHVMAALCAASGGLALRLDWRSDAITGLAWRRDGGSHLLLANLTPEPVRLAFASPLEGRLLDVESAGAAADPAWRDGAAEPLGPTIELGAYAVLFGSG